MINEEAVALCDNVQCLMRSEHTIGPWTTSMAAHDLFWEAIGKHEDEDAVVQHMHQLGIASDQDTRPILEIALKILVDSRCDNSDYELNRLW